MKLKKVPIKLADIEGYNWVHFCYVDEELKKQFEQASQGTLQSWLEVWAERDFGIKKIQTCLDLKELRKAILNLYKSKYPDIYIDSSIDHQGWSRVWVTENMRRELGV